MILEVVKALLEADVTPTDDPVNITVPEVTKRYNQWNQKLFGGQLPKIPIAVRGMKRASGTTKVNYTRSQGTPKIKANSMLYRLMKQSGKTPQVTINSITMVISNNMKMTSENLDQVIIHEMIHVEFAAKGDPFEGHGPDFEKRRKELSRMVGFEIPLTHDVSELKLNDAAQARQVLALVAKRANGKIGFMLIAPTMENKAKEWIDKADQRMAEYKLYKIRTTMASKYTVYRSMPSFSGRVRFFIPQPGQIEHIEKEGQLIHELPHIPLAKRPGGIE